jgi:hypothetical protein
MLRDARLPRRSSQEDRYMRKLLFPALVALASLAPAPALALVGIGVRAGYAMPSGDAAKDQPIKDRVKSNVPIQVDLTLSVFPYVSAGLYGSYGSSTVATGISSGQQLRGGLQLNLRVPVLDAIWAGVFGGLEQQKLSGGGRSASFTGWEGGLQGGYDLSLLPLIKVGPYASYSVAQYQSVSAGQLGAKSNHTQFTIGLRALFDL